MTAKKSGGVFQLVYIDVLPGPASIAEMNYLFFSPFYSIIPAMEKMYISVKGGRTSERTVEGRYVPVISPFFFWLSVAHKSLFCSKLTSDGHMKTAQAGFSSCV